jgi:hypothetical protein
MVGVVEQLMGFDSKFERAVAEIFPHPAGVTVGIGART